MNIDDLVRERTRHLELRVQELARELENDRKKMVDLVAAIPDGGRELVEKLRKENDKAEERIKNLEAAGRRILSTYGREYSDGDQYHALRQLRAIVDYDWKNS